MPLTTLVAAETLHGDLVACGVGINNDVGQVILVDAAKDRVVVGVDGAVHRVGAADFIGSHDGEGKHFGEVEAQGVAAVGHRLAHVGILHGDLVLIGGVVVVDSDFDTDDARAGDFAAIHGVNDIDGEGKFCIVALDLVAAEVDEGTVDTRFASEVNIGELVAGETEGGSASGRASYPATRSRP